MNVTMGRPTCDVLGVTIDASGFDEAIDRVIKWGAIRESRYVAICNAHVVVTAAGDPSYRSAVNGADLATPDGAPVAWMLRRFGFPEQRRVCGPDLMWALCERAQAVGIGVYFFGSTVSTLDLLRRRVSETFPDLRVTFESPPFRTLSASELIEVHRRINDSGAGIVFVGLGCPKQEKWMAEQRGFVDGVMIGVGAAFDFFAGTVDRAPAWMREHGLEWVHRLFSEPRRLWRRYLVTNSLFIWGGARQLVRAKLLKRTATS